MNITPGKLWGLRRLADDAGRFKMLAMDQTGPIVNPIKAALKLDHAPYSDVAAVKRMLGKYLASKASAVLIDPPLGYAAAVEGISPRKGLLVATEWATWEVTPTGRKSQNIPGWNPAVIRKVGGDGVKVNLWFRCDVSQDVKEHQLAYLESIKQACRDQDIPFVLEFLVYPFPDETAEGFSARRVELVLQSLADPDVMNPDGVDVYKLEPPTETTDVPDPDGPHAAQVQARFDKMANGIDRPWVLLSAGSTPEDFLRLLTYAFRSGANGYLAGRAIWSQAFSNFPDMSAMEHALAESAPAIMDKLNALTDRFATPWMDHVCWQGDVAMSPSGEDFASHYAQFAQPRAFG
ncbi:tagatose 1,6-diphosphate aldolase [Oryzicola mucosus]|uniref:Tagatose 1,6-diphosphate aldolase n=1 Tax=Oryzicola mucosus TaxID=2767425 RepID=A0A8J6PMT2_9HYPH|nr:tagatose 1,6-diphosphate aldolase [Oryzicola mucosus]MBD0417183.1 tagatose 1,6-diphosphate aldolase [Oryzicola mucosus]